jgi:hypothetical protein
MALRHVETGWFAPQRQRSVLRTPMNFRVPPGLTRRSHSLSGRLSAVPVRCPVRTSERMQTVLPTSKPILAVPVRPLHEQVRFFALAPARLMPETQLGPVAVAGYARYLVFPALNSSRAEGIAPEL